MTTTLMSFSQACQDQFVMHVLHEKREGMFLEIGSNHPIETNNTYALETNYDWRGIMVEMDSTFEPMYKEHRPRSLYVLQDATQIDYRGLFEANGMPHDMDYLQVDLEVNNRSTRTTLEKLDEELFDNHRFATVTFEHDIYTGNHYDTRQVSRDIFKKRGYVLVFPDVCDHYNNIVFEDWYVHPDLVDMKYVARLMAHNRDHYFHHSITKQAIRCQDISYEGME